jgi:ABC-type Fe3+/spermidine/putrescine transport system ATPase subunit
VNVTGHSLEVGDEALVSVRAAAVRYEPDGSNGTDLNAAECQIEFVEFLGDLVKLHLTAGGGRMLAKLPGEQYPSFRGREGEKIWIGWKEEDVQLLSR